MLYYCTVRMYVWQFVLRWGEESLQQTDRPSSGMGREITYQKDLNAKQTESAEVEE